MFKPFKLIDLTTTPDIAMANLDYIALVLLALKSRALGEPKNIFECVKNQKVQIDSGTFVDVLVYMSRNPKLSNPKELMESVKSLGKDAEDMAMTIYEQLKKQGRQEGHQEGMQAGVQKVASNMISQGLDDNLISTSTGLDIYTIRKLKGETAH